MSHFPRFGDNYKFESRYINSLVQEVNPPAGAVRPCPRCCFRAEPD